MRVVPLSEAVAVNPKIDRTQLADDTPVSFVPMVAVGAANGSIDASTVRPYVEVKKGYTHFRENDVLFAKVTPCMENGKMAVARKLKNGMGFGSTEFHVLRPRDGVDPHYVYYFVSSQTFRKETARHMTGAVGLRRVPSAFLESAKIPLPALEVQREIVAELEKQFSRLDEAVANLQRVKANLKRYKASVLKAAVEGRLVETEATLAHREGRTYETGEQLLQRILAERRAKWAGKGTYKEPEPPVLDGLDSLPKEWVYATTEQMCEQIASGSTPSPEAMFSGAGDVPFLKVYNLTFDGSLDFTVKPTFVSNATHQGMLARSRSVRGDVLMNIVGPPLGKVSIVPIAYPEWNINQAIVTFRTSSGLVNQLLAHWLLARPVLSRLERTAKATAGQHNLQVSTCRKLPIPVPPLAEQKRIVAEVDRHFSIIREVEAEVDANLQRAGVAAGDPFKSVRSLMKPPIYLKLFDKSLAAITSAVEIYNKPGFQYRDETFALLALNAWELILKARVVQVDPNKQKAIHVYQRRPTKSGVLGTKEYLERGRSGNPKTIGIRQAIAKLDSHAPSRLPDAVKNNIEALLEVRDCSAHFFSPSMALRRQLLEVGTAAVRNFVWYGRKWFKKDLSDHLQILLPIGFVNTGGAIVISSAEEKNLLACISSLAQSSAATETNDLHFQTSIEVQIKKTGASNTPVVKITNDPTATPVFLTEENLAQNYPWTYDEVTARCKARYSDFKAAKKYHELRKVLAEETKLYRLRLLDPKNPKGIKKPFYSTNVLAFFDKHYQLK